MFRDPDCIFCKIVTGEIPSHKVYEDEYVYAFLDIGPIARGHTLVIPKHHCESIYDLPEADAAAVGKALVKVAKAVRQTVGCSDLNILQNNGSAAGQAVFHVHFHLIPRLEGDSRGGGEGLSFDWQPGSLDGETGKALAQQMREAIG